jgi:KDO2-lipid IV(A) lauroyltransferase
MADSALKKRKKKKHNLLTDWLGYFALRILVVFLYLFDVETNLNTACFLGRLLWKHYTRGRKRALDNLHASFPEKSEQWRWETGRRSFEHIAMLAMDMLFTPRLVKKSNWRDYSQFKTAERAKWLMQQGKGLLMVASHYSNFEIMGYMLGLFGFNAYSIARPLDNKFINKYLYEVRQRAGQKIIDKKGAAEMIGEIASRGATLCVIADQDANIPIAVAYSRRIDNRFYFEIGINRIIFPEEWAEKDDPLKWVTAEYTKAIEKFVRQDPSQYWWLHRRWKHQPKEKVQNSQSQS